MAELKQCTQCLQWKHATEEYFYKQKQKRKNGFIYTLKSECKECAKEKSYNYQKVHPEEVKKLKHDWHIQHRQRVIEKCKKWRENNLNWKQEYQSNYFQNNPDKVHGYNQKRRHKNHKITKEEWKACKGYFDNSCAYCEMPLEVHKEEFGTDLHKEHVDSNGSNKLDNCVPSCESCNYQKWEHNLDYWYSPENPRFKQERLAKIQKWVNGDYANYLSPKNKESFKN